MKENFNPHNLPLKELNWIDIIEYIGPAHDSIARFDGLLQSIPNPSILLSPLTAQEAVLSSKIEGTQATIQEVLKYEADLDLDGVTEHKRGDIQEILNYRQAMFFAISEMEKVGFTQRLLKGIHKILLSGVRGQNQTPGEFRKKDVYIGTPGKPELARYVPPVWQDLDKHLTNFEQYANLDDKDLIVQLAIIHAQFEIIHPFSDGNGRMGRIIMPLFLKFKGVLNSPMLYLSGYFENHRDEYYSSLQAISDNNDWEQWIQYFLKAVVEQTNENIEKAKKVQVLYERLKNTIATVVNSKYAFVTLDAIFSRPIFNGVQFREISEIPETSSHRILRELENSGVIKMLRKASGRSPAVYSFDELLSIVEV